MSTTLNAEQAALLEKAELEVEGSDSSWRAGNAGRGRVGARRAAGMAIRAWLVAHPNPAYGENFMHHLGGLADDERHPVAVRESAWRLAARGVPPDGFLEPLPDPLVPSTDARSIIAWARFGLDFHS
jgi:hypothetical protein